MRRGVARHALDLFSHINQFMNFRVCIVPLAQLLRFLQGGLQRDIQLHRHQLGNAVHHIIRHRHCPPNIADRTTRCHGAKGYDLCHMVGAIFRHHIVYHLRSAFIAEINVKVRHADTLRV